MTTYADRPWLSLYDPGKPGRLEVEHETITGLFAASVARAPEQTLVRYFGTSLTVAEVDARSDALACALQELGVEAGSRVAVALQNVPQYFLAALATWKLGAIVVPVNPMFRHEELRKVLADSRAVALVALESFYDEVVAEIRPTLPVAAYLTTSELDYVSDYAPVELERSRRARADGTLDLLELVTANDGKRPAAPSPAAGDAALLVYTSGTTGPAKGAIVTHANAVFNAQAYRDWVDLTGDDVILGLAPLFHITGLIGHLVLALLLPIPCLLTYRFDPGATLDLIEAERPTFTAAAITAFIALLNDESAPQRDLSSLTTVLSGGAPVAPSVADAWEERFGSYITNIYGLTETTSPSHMVPAGRRAPVDPVSGALSVGVPIFDTVVRIVDESGAEQPVGEPGEIVTAGPQVVAGYWENPAETAHALAGGELRTGDIGFMNDEGWFFVVDRKKDLINASGFKIWPREVEDVVYQHPAVREVAVVGVPDPYRGETVKAYISLKSGHQLDSAELIAFCRERLAAYKCPRTIELLDELPKTASGKVLRRELRGRSEPGSAGRSEPGSAGCAEPGSRP